MFIGEYRHNLDNKNRLALPAKFRKDLGKKVAVTRGLDSCLFVYPWREWEKVAEKLGELPTGQSDSRDFVRLMLSGAVEAEIDSAGRILVPDYLKEFGGLKETVVVAGLYKRIELWEEGRWNTYKSKVEKQTDSLAEKLGQVGGF